MSIELRPFGIKCNIACLYCYQNMQRDAGNGYAKYNPGLIKKKLTEINQPFHLFGGEPLLMPLDKLADLLDWEFRRNGENRIATNGVLISDAHIDLFKKYNVHVGISIDGPGELNDIRWAGSLEKTRLATQQSISNIYKLAAHNMIPGLQIQVTKCNSAPGRIIKMFTWLRELDEMGICNARLHILEIDSPVVRENYAFTADENIEVFSQYAAFEKTLQNLKFDIFTDVRNMLLGDDQDSPCIWRACDPYTTEAVSGMDGEGRLNNCGLTDKEGINFQKPEKAGYERYISLYQTPQEYGGCKGCRFFLSCKGQCPGTASDGDWRNKSENCSVWKFLFEKAENDLSAEGLVPLSLHTRREEMELEMISNWSSGLNPLLGTLLIDS